MQQYGLLLSLWLVWLILEPGSFRVVTLTSDPKVETAALAAKIPVVPWDNAAKITVNLVPPDTANGPGMPTILTVSTALTQ